MTDLKSKKLESKEIETAINMIKDKREEKGIIPATKKKLLIGGGVVNFSRKSLRIDKGLFKNGQNYSYKAGTSWEDIDAFGRKNIAFNESDFI